MGAATTDKVYYVYKHVDPRTDELLYIGHGCRGRAWIHGSRKTVLRSQDHLDHLEMLTQEGFLAPDWVEVAFSGLTKSEACAIEQGLIRDLSPTYNKPQGLSLLKMTPEMFRECKKLRSDGLFYHQIAEKVGIGTMAVWRALNNQTKNIGENFAE